ncbi:MAG: UDP-2,3-diacylglucosamine diphosphatase LpxI [Phycisphaeraceae bacterium]|nr:UDP-2,3-diacylglucosamine diphosphatase LpxI [Phycisphaeraceae bacterium]
MPEPIGLIAGAGALPLMEARGMRAAGRSVCAVAFAGSYDPQLPGLCDRFAKVAITRPGGWIRRFRGWHVREAVMVGAVRKSRMYDPLRHLRYLPDSRALRLWYRVLRHDRRDQAVLAAIAEELSRSGIELIDSTRYIPDHLASAGPMTKHLPGAHELADIEFGWPILMRMNDLDIGQSIAVSSRDVIAVEAMEGTDAMIERAGKLARHGRWTLLKGPKPDKDMRFDVPTVGIETIHKLAAGGATCLAVAAGRVILLDKPTLLAEADKAGIAVIGVEDTQGS